MTPMNLVSEIAQPISMAFRHFGNIAGGSVLTSLVYSALATVSAAVLGLVGRSLVVGIVILAIGAALLYSCLLYTSESPCRRAISFIIFLLSLLLNFIIRSEHLFSQN